MATMDSTTVVAAATALCAVVFGGVLVYSNKAENELLRASKQQEVEDQYRKLKALKDDIKAREQKVEEESRSLQKQRVSLEELDERLTALKSELEKREESVEESLKAVRTKEQDLKRSQEQLEKQLAERDDEKTADTELSLDDDDHPIGEVLEEEATEEDKAPSSSPEGDKRKKMIDEELSKLIKEANEKELEEPFDEESIEALKKAAHKICYLKKYYDVMKDNFIYFPSVTKTIVDYTLIEEAEKYYYEEDDEYPQDLSIGLRSVATMSMAEENEDVDEDYMLALAQDVEL